MSMVQGKKYKVFVTANVQKQCLKSMPNPEDKFILIRAVEFLQYFPETGYAYEVHKTEFEDVLMMEVPLNDGDKVFCYLHIFDVAKIITVLKIMRAESIEMSNIQKIGLETAVEMLMHEISQDKFLEEKVEYKNLFMGD